MSVAQRHARFKGRPSARVGFNLAIILLALLLGIFRLPEHWAERFYANAMYPRVQAALTPLSNRVPFAILDLVVIGLVAAVGYWWVRRIKRAGRGRRWRSAAA